jgi:hypothetical protein
MTVRIPPMAEPKKPEPSHQSSASDTATTKAMAPTKTMASCRRESLKARETVAALSESGLRRPLKDTTAQ